LLISGYDRVTVFNTRSFSDKLKSEDSEENSRASTKKFHEKLTESAKDLRLFLAVIAFFERLKKNACKARRDRKGF